MSRLDTGLTNKSSQDSSGIGATDYFKAYGNGNLLLEFKRLDLVNELNAVAGGGNRLSGMWV
jgi:hypothetical protein